MKNQRTIILSLLGVLTILLLVYFFVGGSNKKHYLWFESYRPADSQPYGVKFIKELLQGYHSDGTFTMVDKKPLHEILAKDKYKHDTQYIFIGQGLYLSAEDITALTSFVSEGNDAFVSSVEFPKDLLHDVYVSPCDSDLDVEAKRTESVVMNFYHDTLRVANGYKFTYRYGTNDEPYEWNIFQPAAFCDSTTALVPLGFQDHHDVNFVKIPYGKGNFYLHSNPLAFTNYFLTKEDKVDYASSVFSHVRGKNILWDEYSKVPLPNDSSKRTNPLAYILQQPSLKYAWWMMLGTILLYIVFTAKRTQRIIHVLEQKTNTSLEFVRLIAALHYQNGNNVDIARKKMKYFQYYIRSRYGMNAAVLSDEQMVQLSERSKVELAIIQSIYKQNSTIERYAHNNILPATLVDFYNTIEKFYKNSK